MARDSDDWKEYRQKGVEWLNELLEVIGERIDTKLQDIAVPCRKREQRGEESGRWLRWELMRQSEWEHTQHLLQLAKQGGSEIEDPENWSPAGPPHDFGTLVFRMVAPWYEELEVPTDPAEDDPEERRHTPTACLALELPFVNDPAVWEDIPSWRESLWWGDIRHVPNPEWLYRSIATSDADVVAEQVAEMMHECEAIWKEFEETLSKLHDGSQRQEEDGESPSP